MPKLDAAFSQVSKSIDLSFEGMGILKDAMDKRMDTCLGLSSYLSQANNGYNMTHNLETWLFQIQSSGDGYPKTTNPGVFSHFI